MLWLAGLMGLLAVGALGVVDMDGDGEDEAAEDEAQETNVENGDTIAATDPAGTTENDPSSGNDGDDILRGSNGDDTIEAGAGNDRPSQQTN